LTAGTLLGSTLVGDRENLGPPDFFFKIPWYGISWSVGQNPSSRHIIGSAHQQIFSIFDSNHRFSTLPNHKKTFVIAPRHH
jgi:hypothetical protein